jgi:hypothetical protein
MGVPIVFHHVANQPHTSSPHFSSFPTRTPRLSLYSSIFYLHLRSIMNPPFHPQSVCPSANLPSFHLPHTETHQWGPHPSSVSQAHYALRGPPISHWGTRFCICTFLPKLFIIYCTNAFISSHYILFLSSPLATCFLPFFGHTQPMSPLVGALLIIYPCHHRPSLQSTPQVTYLYPLNLFTLSRFWHNLSSVLSSP